MGSRPSAKMAPGLPGLESPSMHSVVVGVVNAGQIYRPSYISLHTALSFYGMIPEGVVSLTSISPLKTAFFENAFGQYIYYHVKPELFFGYKPMLLLQNHSVDNSSSMAWMLALPEKALLDLLYLYPFYNTEQEMIDLRLDEEFMAEDLDLERLGIYLEKMRSKALDARVKLLQKSYGLR